jgi:hypothetical protein
VLRISVRGRLSSAVTSRYPWAPLQVGVAVGQKERRAGPLSLSYSVWFDARDTTKDPPRHRAKLMQPRLPANGVQCHQVAPFGWKHDLIDVATDANGEEFKQAFPRVDGSPPC